MSRFCLLIITWLAAFSPVLAQSPANPLQDAVILIIRHAEKPESGDGLAPAGQKRAEAYVNYFKTFTVNSKPLHLDALFATADSKNSRRPRLTVEPLSRALHLPVNNRVKDKDFQQLVDELKSRSHGKEILICWHHGEIPSLIRGLGAEPETLLPEGKWPANIFSWVIELHYDHAGHLVPEKTKRISENLMAGD